MKCARCAAPLDADHAEKCRILDEIFGDPLGDHLCDPCYARLPERIKRLAGDLRDPIWWHYHSPLRMLFYYWDVWKNS
jgi:hypothetical protein